MSGPSIFSPRLLIVWIAAAVLTFACSLYFMTQGEGGRTGSNSIGPSAFSRSAIGYAGIAEILRTLGIEIVKSQADSLAKLGDDSVLVIAEPRPKLQSRESVSALLDADTVLLILPKWRGSASETKAGWIEDAQLVSLRDAQWALDIMAPKDVVVRDPAISHWTTNMLHRNPEIAAPVQLIFSSRLKPIVAAQSGGILLGEMRQNGSRIWVLSDPDVIDNHGLKSDANAAFAVGLVNALRGQDGSVVFDETLHGFIARTASPLKLLFQYPFVFTTAQGFVALLLLLWATTSRFGAPEPAPPALDAGKQGLIRNAARLLVFAGHRHVMVRRYVQATLRDVARQLHAPRGIADGALLDWLQRVSAARAVTIDCVALSRRVDEFTGNRRGDVAPLIAIARDAHQWKCEIIDGPQGNSRRH